jgi:hypothetical protein
MPKALNIATPEGYIKYQIKVQIVGNEIIITLKNSINDTIISPEYYEAIRLVFDSAVAKSKEKIILSKL